ARRAAAPRPGRTQRLTLERLEDRYLLSFGPAASYRVGMAPLGLAAGEARTGFGVYDLAAANSGSGDLTPLTGNGDGSFVPQAPVSDGRTPLSVAAADFNGDGVLDLAAGTGALGCNGGGVSVFPGYGGGSFGYEGHYPVVTCANSLA